MTVTAQEAISAEYRSFDDIDMKALEMTKPD